VVDSTQAHAGAFGSQLLGNLGAEILKIEPPVRGDGARVMAPKLAGESCYFLALNRNKERQVLVETTEKGKGVYRREAQKMHVNHRVLATLSPKERQQLKSILQKLRTKLFEELAEEPPY
jgi:crotonobetainyl-CoA:carnitine CoA-transferase CaiB-like acyl-CoA transferase